jgi:hypothetical protein
MSSTSLPAMPPTSAVTHAQGTHFLAQTNLPPLALPNTPSYPSHSDMLGDADIAAQARSRSQREANLAEAQRWRLQADELGTVIKRDTDYFATLTARWRELVHMPHRSRQDDFDLAQLEVEVPRYSQRLARARKRWTECLERAREHEDRAREV